MMRNAGIPPQPLAQEDSFSDLVRTVEQRRTQLVRVAQRMTRCQEDAEDVVQDSVLKALANLSTFRGDSRLDTWLHAIVVNTARSRLRSQCGRVYIPIESDDESERDSARIELPHPGKDPEEFCSTYELQRLLLAEIASLDPIYGTLIRMCDLDQRSYRETAQALHLNIATVKARLFRGRALLRRKLRRHLPRDRRQRDPLGKGKRKRQPGEEDIEQVGPEAGVGSEPGSPVPVLTDC